jgi:hypothetical protein
MIFEGCPDSGFEPGELAVTSRRYLHYLLLTKKVLPPAPLKIVFNLFPACTTAERKT